MVDENQIEEFNRAMVVVAHADDAEWQEQAKHHDQRDNVYPGSVLKDEELGLARQQVKQGLGNGKADEDKDVQAGSPACLPMLC